MPDIKHLLDDLSERAITQAIDLRHDEARVRYHLSSNTVDTFDAFTTLIADYYNHHFGYCVAQGAALPKTEAAGRAKEILDNAYRRQTGGDVVAAFQDAKEGANGGMRRVLDIIADGLKQEATDRYIRAVFDRHVAPHDWDQKVEIIRQFLQLFGPQLGPSVEANRPERYAHDYTELISAYVQLMRQASSTFRKL